MIDSWQLAGWVISIALIVVLFPKAIKMIVALVILHALLSNEERYKYIAKLAEETDEEGKKKYTNQELTEKNIHKASKMAEQFLNWIHW